MAKEISSLDYQYQFTVATIVNNGVEYKAMLHSYWDAGFTEDICEFIYVDNQSKNNFDAYQAINLFLQLAQGEYIIICHQDVLINYDNVVVLKQQIKNISKLDANWAILSNAGGIENNLYQRISAHVVYGNGYEQIEGKLPQKVCSVDENFMVIKRSANLALSRDLSGFHLYGTDICLIAELLGYSAYAIDFKLTHKSYGKPDSKYYSELKELIRKYTTFMRGRTILTTITDFRLSSSSLSNAFFQIKTIQKIYRKFAKIKTDSKDRRPQTVKTKISSKYK